ncbi:MAG: glycoside hydrolase family 88 protein, partial [Cytophagaceae bacterium]
VLARYQDPKTGVWSLVMGHEAEQGNYAEASGSAMFVYALAKGSRLGYLDKKYAQVARRGYNGLLKTFVAPDASGALALNGTVSVGGLGGTPYRDGTLAYYTSEPLRVNDLKGVGPLILASVEMEIATENAVGQGKTVGLDYYFNHELRKNTFTGQPEQWHYTWEERTHGGFWLWGNQLRELGARTIAVPAAPTAASLKPLSIYLIVDPDTKKETPTPHYLAPAENKVITDWVRAGGTLVLLANDTANCEIRHFNELAKNFGVQFTSQSVNMVQGSQFEQGRVDLSSGAAVFPRAKTAYIKELAVLATQAPAQPLVVNGGKNIMATVQLGKGRVFVLGDPWLYNEYTDGRKIPATFENFQAGKDLGRWLLR